MPQSIAVELLAPIEIQQQRIGVKFMSRVEGRLLQIVGHIGIIIVLLYIILWNNYKMSFCINFILYSDY